MADRVRLVQTKLQIDLSQPKDRIGELSQMTVSRVKLDRVIATYDRVT